MKKLYKYLFLSTTIVAFNINNTNALETYIEGQSGSLMGLAHISGGIRLAERHNLQAGVGYVPKMSDHAEMTLLSVRYRYDSPLQYQVGDMVFKPFNIGMGVLIGSHDELFVTLPDRYPTSDYYMPSALRLVFNYQATLQFAPQWEAFLDISAIDVGVLGYVREPGFYNDNYDFFGLTGITNWGLGLRYTF